MAQKTEKYAEQYEKKKLQGFLADLLKVGCIKGFRYFSMYLRGREELLVRVQNEQMSTSRQPSQSAEDSDSSSFTFDGSLPRNTESLILSRDSQRSLSGFNFLEIGLPPASPCENDIAPRDHFSTLFLVAAYARYRCPYVWVRSNHKRLIKISESPVNERSKIKDSPLKLRSITDWSTKDIKIWDILSEIIRMNVIPMPRNPFAVDFDYFNTLPPMERIIATGAMAYFLQKVIISKDRSYNSKISEDLHEVTKRHFEDLKSVVTQTNALSSNSMRNQYDDEEDEKRDRYYQQNGSQQTVRPHYQTYRGQGYSY